MLGSRRMSAGFSLIEVMIVVVVVGILASIAYPSYVNSIMRTHRATAQACLGSYAAFMERFYTTNLRYDQDTAGDAVTLPVLECASASNSGDNYTYSLVAANLGATTYTLQATPIGTQASRDSQCATLSMTHTGDRGASGTGGAAECW